MEALSSQEGKSGRLPVFPPIDELLLRARLDLAHPTALNTLCANILNRFMDAYGCAFGGEVQMFETADIRLHPKCSRSLPRSISPKGHSVRSEPLR